MRILRRGPFLPVTIGLAVALAFTAWPVAPARAALAKVTDVSLTDTPTEMLVTVAASGPVHSQLVDAHPNWIVVDIHGAALGMAGGTLPLSKGVVWKVRIGQFQPGVVRLVVELGRSMLGHPVKARVNTSPDGSVVVVGVPLPAARRQAPAHAQAARGDAPAAPAPPAATAGPAAPMPPAVPGVPAATVPAPATAAASDPAAAPASSKLINLDLSNAQIADVLSALAKLAGVNIVTDTNVKGTITVRLRGVTFQQAMQLILQPNDLAYTTVGSNIIVAKREDLMKPFLREYRLTNIDAQTFAATILPVTGVKKEAVSVDEANNTLFVVGTADDQQHVYALLQSVDVPAERSETRVIRLSYIDAATFLDLLGAKLPDAVVKTAKVDRESNSVVITATAAQMQTVASLEQQVDNPLSQVLIEASVVEIPTSELKQLGVNWENPITFNLTSTGTDNATGQLAYAVTTPSPITAILNLLITNSKARLLANPRLAVQDGKTATMNIGSKIPFQVLNAQGVPSLVIIDAGVQLSITPRVNRDGFITVNMHPEVSAIQTPPSAGVPPTISTREATTSLTVKDGSSIILAGLIQKNETKTTVKVPLLGDIPILGWLFRSETTNTEDNEVVFVITPHILPKVGT